MHIDELEDLGSFVAITEAPEGMFETQSKHFSPKVKEAQQKMYMTFVQKKGLWRNIQKIYSKRWDILNFFIWSN